MVKNTAGQKIGAQLVSASDGSAFTGSVTVSVTGDAGTQATGSVGAGACTHEGNGYHTYAPAQAETNYDLIAFTFTGTGAVPVTVQVFTTANLVTSVWASVVDSSGVTTLLSRLSSTRAGYLDNLSAGAVATASALTSVASDVTTLLSRITSTLFTGITSLAEWLGLIAGKQTGNSTARTELRATGAGSGTYDETTDSQEALRDRGDAAWTTATGFSTLDAAGVRTAVGLASANLDTQLDALPTAAENASQVRTELTTELARVDVAVSTRLASASYTAPLDAAGTRSAVGLASANLDTQLSAIDDYLDTEIAAILAAVDTEVGAIKTVTDQLVAAQSEPSAVPAANATPLAKIAWLAALARNKVTQTATTQTVYADDGTTTIAAATVSDDATTYTRGEFA